MRALPVAISPLLAIALVLGSGGAPGAAPRAEEPPTSIGVPPGDAAAEAPSPGETPDPAIDVTGTFDSTFGNLVLTQEGTRVTGTYDCCDGGTIRGTLEGDTIRFRWRQPDAVGSGRWRVEQGGAVLRGRWGTGLSEIDGGGWTAVRPDAVFQEPPDDDTGEPPGEAGEAAAPGSG